MSTEPTAGPSPAAVATHYDAGNDFYRVWLDESLTYSCAMWDPDDGPDDIEAAQQRKLDWFLDRLADGRPGDTRSLLDVGCGWGAAMGRAVATGRFERATGITVSEAQAAHIRATAAPSIDVSVVPWKHHRPDRPFDALVSIGALEHFAAPEDGSAERIGRYAEFFEHAWGVTAPRAVMGIQTIAADQTDAEKPQRRSKTAKYLGTDVFGGSALPRVHEVLAAADPWFRLLDLRLDPQDYSRTCVAWRRRLLADREAAERASDAEVVDAYARYLAVSGKSFDFGWCTLARFVFRRRTTPVNGASVA